MTEFIRLRGIPIAALPEADSTEMAASGPRVWFQTYGIHAYRGSVWDSGDEWEPDEAREVAAYLIAAAEVADQQNDGIKRIVAAVYADEQDPLDTELPASAEEVSAALAYATGLDDAKMWMVRVAGALDMLRIDIDEQGYNVATADEAVAEVYRLARELHACHCEIAGLHSRIGQLEMALNSPLDPGETSLPNIADTCCGKCPGGTCYVDQITGA